jgi:hypothetical protein
LKGSEGVGFADPMAPGRTGQVEPHGVEYILYNRIFKCGQRQCFRLGATDNVTTNARGQGR